jgi:ribosomal protein S18 acetylase RimI-like enzyme
MRIEPEFPRLMFNSLEVLLNWAYGLFPETNISLEVISTNQRAITLYEKLGFRPGDYIPLKTTYSNEGITSLAECEVEQSDVSEMKIIMVRIIN